MCLFIVQKKNKRKEKENQYKIRKIKEKKIVSVQASHNSEVMQKCGSLVDIFQ